MGETWKSQVACYSHFSTLCSIASEKFQKVRKFFWADILFFSMSIVNVKFSILENARQ